MSDQIRIHVFDVNGKEIYTEELDDYTGKYSKEIDLSSNDSGIYILKISQADKMLIKKIIIE